MSGDWVHVGEVIIETGRLALVDPALADEVVHLEGNEDVVVGAPGLLVSTGLGDGRYPVDVLYEDLGDLGRRVACVQITFLPDHTHDDDEE
jgi:hypothetical protein